MHTQRDLLCHCKTNGDSEGPNRQDQQSSSPWMMGRKYGVQPGKKKTNNNHFILPVLDVPREDMKPQRILQSSSKASALKQPSATRARILTSSGEKRNFRSPVCNSDCSQRSPAGAEETEWARWGVEEEDDRERFNIPTAQQKLNVAK